MALPTPLIQTTNYIFFILRVTVFITGLFILLCTQQSFAAALPETGSDADQWKTIRTELLHVHFQQKYEKQARHVAAVYSLYAPIMEKYFNHKPDTIDLVVSDSTDSSNGFSSFFPRNINTIFLTPPIDGALVDQQNWIDLVTRHELTHLYHIDSATGAPRFLRNVLGRFLFLFPQTFQPNWFIEGIATYQETDQSRRIGRGSNGYFDAIMRLEMEQGFRSITSTTYNGSGIPWGVSYYYGYYFFEYLDSHYGQDLIQQYVTSFSDRIIPFRIDNQAKKVFGLSIFALWDDYQKYLQQKFGYQTQQIIATGLTQAQTTDTESLLPQQPAYDAQGNLYYLHYDGYSSPVFRQQQHTNDAPFDLFPVSTGVRYFDVSPAGDIAYTASNLCGKNQYNDIYIKRQDMDKPVRLGECQRYKSVRWHPNGTTLFATRYTRGNSELSLLEANGEHRETLLQTESPSVIGTFAVSPDGNTLVLSLYKQEHGWELYSLERTNGNTLTRLTNNLNDIELEPSFSRDGKFIVYASNQGGIYNIRRLQFDSPNQEETLTNVLSLASMPAINPVSGALSYSQLTSNGFLLQTTIPVKKTTLYLDQKVIVEHQQPWFNLREPITEPANDYTAFNSYLAPAWWLPYAVLTEDQNKFGFITSGNDQLRYHQYSLNLSHTRSEVSPGLSGFAGELSYVLDTNILIDLQVNRHTYIEDFSNDQDIYNTQKSLAFRYIVDLYSHQEVQSKILFGLVRNTDELTFQQKSYNNLHHNVGGAIFLLNNATRYYYDYGLSAGSTLYLLAETYQDTNERITSQPNTTGNAAGIQFSHYLNAGSARSLGLHYHHLYRDQDLPAFRLGGSEGTQQITINKHFYGLPGYEQGNAALITHRFQLLSIHYIQPLSQSGFGGVVPPVGIGKQHLRFTLFSASIDEPLQQSIEPKKVYSGISGEFNTTLHLGFGLFSLPVSIFYAQGLNPGIGISQFGIRFRASL